MSKLDLHQFEKLLTVRQLRPEDYKDVVALQLKCFPKMDPWTAEQFQSQLQVFPEGQLGVEYEGRLVASASSLILDFELYKDWHNWDEIADYGFIRNHKADGKTLYGIEIMVDPDYRGLKLARRLYDARKELARERNLMRIVIGGRIPGYAKYADKMTAREYIDQVLNKTLYDPVMTTQLSNGFVLKRLISGYLATDADSKGYAAFLEWANLDFVPDAQQRFMPDCTRARLRRSISDAPCRRTSRRSRPSANISSTPASDYKCDFILFPEIFTTQILSFVRASTARRSGPETLRIHARLPRSLHAPRGKVQHQHHRRFAFHRGGRQALQHRLPLSPRRYARQAVQAPRHPQ